LTSFQKNFFLKAIPINVPGRFKKIHLGNMNDFIQRLTEIVKILMNLINNKPNWDM